MINGTPHIKERSEQKNTQWSSNLGPLAQQCETLPLELQLPLPVFIAQSYRSEAANTTERSRSKEFEATENKNKLIDFSKPETAILSSVDFLENPFSVPVSVRQKISTPTFSLIFFTWLRNFCLKSDFYAAIRRVGSRLVFASCGCFLDVVSATLTES